MISLELVGPNLFNKDVKSHIISEIDAPIANVRYLNLERILIRNSKKQLINFLKEVQEDLTFEYKQKLDSTSHSLTMVQNGMNDDDIVPYEVFKQQRETNGDTPLFTGFKNLFFLKITTCELNNVNWEMFEGLEKLEYLILEKNNLRFIPAFAFYGTPNLKTLSLAHNKLLDIEITDLVGLLQLEYLDLSFNNFTQLSELSLPPFPKLKLANFANNPISVIFPNTFEVMNTTNSLIIGSDDMPLTLITNSLVGLTSMEKLILNNLELRLLKRDMFVGMPNLKELTLTGNITELEYDTFLEVNLIEKLILTNCQIMNISMDSFMGLQKLTYLDLSKNKLEYLPPGVFDQLVNIKELYLNSNNFKKLPREIFSKIYPKLIRLNENPWHCSCDMSDWKPLIVNRVKQRVILPCEFSNDDKGLSCSTEKRLSFKYVYDNKVAPKCAEPDHFVNWSVFHAMRKILRCPDYKPRLKKHLSNKGLTTYTGYSTSTTLNPATESFKMTKLEKLNYKLQNQMSIDKTVSTEYTNSKTYENDEKFNNILQTDLNNYQVNSINNNFESNNLLPVLHPINTLETNLVPQQKPIKKRRLRKGHRILKKINTTIAPNIK